MNQLATHDMQLTSLLSVARMMDLRSECESHSPSKPVQTDRALQTLGR